MNGVDFKTRLKAVRKTQDDLARYLGKDRTTVSRILSGETGMLLEVSREIEAFLRKHETAAGPSGVAERSSPYAPAPTLSLADRERILRELAELGAALRSAPRLSDLSDEELLGYEP
ncbi:MAG: helix-turn-helix transcriptional regulator [Hyphomonadaceae bacterium]|nr:MAG: hypothetical protein FD160_1865 [Caulobacteraceae bacterium]MBT9445507.1 helix-turn-helix transcriptional regulator [Hyphomonadaceae bacterium]TPW04195.1 MAG: hypothetical protein FD124_2713 [Alphaproteobacteria bacterium]